MSNETRIHWIATAEHTAGASVGHPCTSGAWPDPTDDFQESVSMLERSEARNEALAELLWIADNAPVCNCKRQLQAGSDSWVNSVCISLWPQTQEAMAIVMIEDEVAVADIDDPYSLIPAELKTVVSSEQDKASPAPRPWKVCGKSIKSAYHSREVTIIARVDSRGKFVPGCDEANAALIVRAVNNHDALVKAIEDIMHECVSMPGDEPGPISWATLDAARDVWRSAKGLGPMPAEVTPLA